MTMNEVSQIGIKKGLDPGLFFHACIPSCLYLDLPKPSFLRV